MSYETQKRIEEERRQFSQNKILTDRGGFSRGLNQSPTWLQAKPGIIRQEYLSTMFYVPVQLNIGKRRKKQISLQILLDSGASMNFLSPRVIHQHKIPTRKLNQRIKLTNMDETLNSMDMSCDTWILAQRSMDIKPKNDSLSPTWEETMPYLVLDG